MLLNKFKAYLTKFNVTSMESIMKLIKTILFLILLLHYMACVWLYLGRYTKHGWIKTNDEYNSVSKYSEFNDLYPVSIYFIVTTITTVGYGDIGPGDE